MFIKLGQILSIRGDLLPEDIIIELEQLQDKVPPFDSQQAIDTIEKSFNKPIKELFKSFEIKPIASASIAQVHEAVLNNGQRVAVKIIRPGISDTIQKEIRWMRFIGRIMTWAHPHSARLRFLDIVDEFERSIKDEINLHYEAGNAGQFRRQFQSSDDLYIPEIYWDLVARDVMVMEFIEGVNIYDLETLEQQQVSLPQLAKKGLTVFFEQMLEHSFFHADLHPGNLFVDTTLPDHPKFIAIDFGIVGMLNQQDRHYITHNFIAFFKQDYRRIAELHIESGWVPSDTKVDQFESSIRTICEPLFSRSLGDISLAKLMLGLFQVARQFKTEIQPQLLMLQKTLFTVEALGRKLDPDLNLWLEAKPILEAWAYKNSNWTNWVQQAISKPPYWLDPRQRQPKKCQPKTEKSNITLRLSPILYILISLTILLSLTDLPPNWLIVAHFILVLTQIKK